MPGDFLVRNSDRIHPDTLLVSDYNLAPAVCWFYQRDDVYLLGKPGEFEYGLSYDTDKNRLIPVQTFADFLARHSQRKPVVLILRQNRYDAYRAKLPKPVHVTLDGGFVMTEYECEAP